MWNYEPPWVTPNHLLTNSVLVQGPSQLPAQCKGRSPNVEDNGRHVPPPKTTSSILCNLELVEIKSASTVVYSGHPAGLLRRPHIDRACRLASRKSSRLHNANTSSPSHSRRLRLTNANSPSWFVNCNVELDQPDKMDKDSLVQCQIEIF